MTLGKRSLQLLQLFLGEGRSVSPSSRRLTRGWVVSPWVARRRPAAASDPGPQANDAAAADYPDPLRLYLLKGSFGYYKNT